MRTDSSYSSTKRYTIGCHLTRWSGLSHLKISIHELWRLPTNFPLSYNLLPCLSLTRSRRAWMEEWFCPSHCLICLGKALTSNTNLNDSSGNLGSVSEARLGLAQWPSPREHGKFAGSICHRQHELRKRTRVIKWVGSMAGFGRCQGEVQLWLYYEIIWNCIKVKFSHCGCVQLYKRREAKEGKKKIIPKNFFQSPIWKEKVQLTEREHVKHKRHSVRIS